MARLPPSCLALGLLLLLSVEGAEKERCENGSDCDPGECCLARGLFFIKGLCKKMSAENERCSEASEKYSGRYLAYCPCLEGLRCVPEEEKEIPHIGTVKMRERCLAE